MKHGGVIFFYSINININTGYSLYFLHLIVKKKKLMNKNLNLSRKSGTEQHSLSDST
jgi:hypothetical protein